MGDLLSIYLNDHFAGATGGIELARRVRAANQDDEAFGPPLTEICAEIEADRETLTGLMDQLGIRRDPLKPAAAWAVEKLGRLKLNGQLTGYSPLSRQVELEGLLIGIAGKEQMWKALGHALGPRVGEHDFAQLAERAERQRAVVGELHLEAASRALRREVPASGSGHPMTTAEQKSREHRFGSSPALSIGVEEELLLVDDARGG